MLLVKLPFVSTELKLWRGARVLQHKEIINVPGVGLWAIAADVASLLNKQRLQRIVTFNSDNFDELDTENTAVFDEESRGLLLKLREGDHA